MTDQQQQPPAAPKPPLTPEQQRQRQLQALMRSPVPKIYTNGLALNATATELSLVFLETNSPVGIVMMSYTMAKSLSVELDKALKDYERRTGEKVSDIKEILAKISANKSGS